jgi:hypothetical protein
MSELISFVNVEKQTCFLRLLFHKTQELSGSTKLGDGGHRCPVFFPKLKDIETQVLR